MHNNGSLVLFLVEGFSLNFFVVSFMFSQSQNCSQLRSLLTVLAANSKLPLAHFYGYFTAIFLLFMCYHSTSTVQIQIKSERIERQRRRRPLINGSNYGAANDSRSF